MTLYGNIVFFIFGGFIIVTGYAVGGVLLCLTIVGIPFGFQCFKLAGAVLAPFGHDVFQTEPLPESSPLWSMDNVIVSPHVSGDFIGHREAIVDLFTDNFRRFRMGEPLRNVVDKTRGYVSGP